MTGPELTADPQFEALLRQVAGVSVASRAAPVEPPLPAGTQLGPYRLLEIAGSGGMGVVYRAHDERLARDVALKLLPKDAGLDARARDQLLAEARAAAALSHPNLASVYETGTLDQHVYFAMELVRGTSLRTLITTREGTGAARLELGLGVAKGLAAMHRAGWIHRDVKPENVMVTADGTVKLLDLGLATQNAAAAPTAGTPGYLAPEQRRGEPPDARSDVYALGLLLRELLGSSRVVERCLEESRERRFSTAAEVVAALEATRKQRSVAPWVAAAAVLLVAVTAWLSREAPLKPLKPARRLTGHAMLRPISDAALAADGRTFAFVDDEGLWLGDVVQPERAQRVPLDETPGSVEPAPGGFTVLTHGAGGEISVWHLEGGQPRRLYTGAFKFASPSPAADRVVTVEGTRVVVRKVPGGAELSAVAHPETRMLNAARWSPNAELYALAYSDRANGELQRTLELWAADGKQPLWSLRTQRLAQAYVPIVFAWSARGTLLYALTDEPGEGNGSAVWELSAPSATPHLIAPVEGQFLRGVGQGANGELLTVRESTHQRVQLADVAPGGELERPRALTQSELDERPTGWESPATVLLMSLRNLVPHLARRDVSRPDSELIAGKGWAQTWPTATGRPGEILYWWTAGRDAPWQLSLKQGAVERALQLPGLVYGTVSTISAPPHAQRVRCGAGCVLSVPGAFYDLDLDGGAPSLRFRVTEPAPVWALSSDGERIATAGGSDLFIRVLDRKGAELSRHAVPHLEDVRGVAFAADGFYVSGMGADGLQRVGRLTVAGVLDVLQSSPSAFAELHLSPDGRSLAYLEKEFDADLWFTP